MTKKKTATTAISPPSAAPITAYGTASLESDANLHAHTIKRRQYMKWALTGLSGGALVALVALGFMHFGRSSDEATAAVAMTHATPIPFPINDAITCFQSSYVNGDKKMMQSIAGLEWKKRSHTQNPPQSFIKVDTTKLYQEVYGFGGAFTEASALQFQKLSPEKQEEVLKLYFDPEHGSAYTFGRVPMGSCDFSVSSYSFDDVANDTSMHHFDLSVEHDTKVLIPFIKRALEKQPNLKLFLAPWSPPSWMKLANETQLYIPSMLGSAMPNGLNGEFREAWALYFSKFITAYKNYGIRFWGLTPQNEPEFAAPWEACGYDAHFQADFVGEFLGPIIRRDHPEVKIMIFDHNRGSVWHWAKTVYNHPTAKDYVDGMAFHWYDDERYMDGVEFHERLNDTHFVDENRFLLATESCNCPGVAHGNDAWFRAQRYAHDIITDFNNWVVGWVDWNLILDHTGGPNHLGNNCDAPIILDETEKDYYVQPMYYFIQHFSKFVPPGSRRIASQVAATFTKPGDPQLFVKYPAAMHACDNSSRQLVHRTDDNKLQITNTGFCIDMIPVPWQGFQVQLVECIYTTQTWTFEDDSGVIRMNDQCLSLNHGSTQDGVRVVVYNCTDVSSTSDHQRWYFENGLMHSHAANASQCVTAGYSFVQSAAFVTPENKKILVVLNENTEEAAFELQFGDAIAQSRIPQGAIQTYVWE